MEKSEKRKAKSSGRTVVGLPPIELSKVKGQELHRISTGIGELDNVLGGGLVAGQVVLLAGEPGIGKSTLLIEVADKVYSKVKEKKIIYIAGEESVGQIHFRTKRLGIRGEGIYVVEETDVDEVISQISQIEPNKQSLALRASLIVIDSIQTLTTGDLTGTAGSVGQVRESAARIASEVKRYSIPTFLVGHVTKEGTIAGPRVLEHMVDTVLWFEGERSQNLRILRAVKNRFGPTDEVGIFEMSDRGLVPIENPSKLFVSGLNNVPGQVSTVVLEGTRPLVVEIQALVVPTKLPVPRRVVQGVDQRRVEVVLAVLARRLGLPIYNFDVFVNAAGGINIREPGADLAIALSLASAISNKPLGAVAACGEVGLLGEIRSVSQETRRVKEAKRLGFKTVLTPASARTVGEVVRKYISKN